MSIQYHSVIPENNKTLYSEFEVVDFICQFPGRRMNLNSVRLEGSLLCKDDNDYSRFRKSSRYE
jgi:hypothetical protein